MRKILSALSIILVVTLMSTMFAGCTIVKKFGGNGKLKVGLIQLGDHYSLNEIRKSFEEELSSLAKTEKLEIDIEYKNAQFDNSQINTICKNFVENKVDAIVAIATPAAQGAATATSDIPIVFSAVSDPVDANLLENPDKPEGNITGVSDAIDVEKIFSLASELTPDVKSFGLLYNNAESNSVAVIKEVKEYLASKNITVSEKTVSNSGEVQQAARVLFETCDAVFSPIDNTVASAMAVVTAESKSAKKPMYVSADSMVLEGGLATVGVNYKTLGRQTAAMAIKVLKGSAVNDIPVEVITETAIVVNEETAKAIGIDVSKYVK